MLGLSEGFRVVGVRSVSLKGGSLQVTIPADVAQDVGLNVGDIVVILYDTRRKQILISKAGKISTPEGLTFSLANQSLKRRPDMQ